MNDPGRLLLLFAAGEEAAAAALADPLGAPRARALEPAGEADAPRVAAALVAAERVITEEGPGAVVLLGAGPEVGAAVLVAVKLGLPVARVTPTPPAGGPDPATLANLDGAVAERLAALVVPGGDDAKRTADAIRAWLATYTLQP